MRQMPIHMQVTIATARWKTGDFRVDGTGSKPGADVQIYRVTRNAAAGTTTEAPIQTARATVLADGTWSLRVRNAAAPTANPALIRAKSTLGGTSPDFAM